MSKWCDKHDRNSLYSSQMAHPTKPYPGFFKIKRPVGVLILPPGWDAYLLQFQHFIRFPRQCAVILLGGVKHCENKVCRPRTQHNNAIEQDRGELKIYWNERRITREIGKWRWILWAPSFTRDSHLPWLTLKKIICLFPQVLPAEY